MTLAAFEIGRYPVSNVEYAEFVEPLALKRHPTGRRAAYPKTWPTTPW